MVTLLLTSCSNYESAYYSLDYESNLTYESNEEVEEKSDEVNPFNESLIDEEVKEETEEEELIDNIEEIIDTFKKTNEYTISDNEFLHCNMIFDKEYENYVDRYDYVFDDFCNVDEKLPYVSDFFYDKYLVLIMDVDEWSNLALYLGDGNIVINKKYWTLKDLDEAIAHEMTHSAIEGLWLPLWLEEGIADYHAFKYVDKIENIRTTSISDIELWDEYSDDYGTTIKQYIQARYIVRKLVENYDDDIIYNLIIELDGEIDYYDSIEIKNEKVLDAIKKITNDENITLDEIVNPQDYD
ncbi:hypothetical protein HN385_04920 [archaeon]|nr:hypothetical protein [archaeon]MBT3451309.1 hypothetical protein [archaeon]MBT6869289.1 hypothetical protein [archaeon]MBT7381201.1 hypothetical protein [archaeon]MBT7508550.1 hypothetical protein [archaeon]